VNDQRNMIMAIVLSAFVLFGWSFASDKLFPQPKSVPQVTAPAPQAAAPAAAGGAVQLKSREAVLAATPRVLIDTPKLGGSINLGGARIDDLVLRGYKETINKGSPDVRLLSPSGAKSAYFAEFGWLGTGAALPDSSTIWTADKAVLTPDSPVTLSWDNGAGQLFAIRFAVDKDYMFTVQQRVSNRSAGTIGVRSFGLLSRSGHSPDPSSWTHHSGPMGVFNGAANYSLDYKEMDEGDTLSQSTVGGWLGYTDKYWLTALIPDQKANVAARFTLSGADRYQADLTPANPSLLSPGKTLTSETRFFAGAKEVSLLERYQHDNGVVQFDKAIDWGWFYWFEKPIFYTLDWLFRMVGNFGVAIILLTMAIRGLMFPIAQKQFSSMAAMRVVQPKVKLLQERYKDDKAKLQQEMMALYQQEKVNPFAGCMPIFVQIPIFYALYKVLTLTIEMRHQPFALWLKDLSAPDPLTPINLFGLLDFTPPSFLALGVLPILLGITMWAQFKLNPAPMDPVQQQVFSLMPWILMFVMAPFASGLQLYWVVSNLFTITQQRYFYATHPVLKNQKG
jgi:YidC/Oxa1 family membrane protein insertase